jgi:Cu+-exporting ATPase
MHPEIVRDAPGNCPICGMALEPRTVTLEDVENIHLKDITRRFRLSVVLSVPLIITGMAEMIWGVEMRHAINETVYGWTQLALATPVVLWGGWPFFRACVGEFPHPAAQHV